MSQLDLRGIDTLAADIHVKKTLVHSAKSLSSIVKLKCDWGG